MRSRIAVIFLLVVCTSMPSPAQSPEPVCALSEDQTQKSIDAFAKLVPLFKHDRCINCHGDINPFDEDNGNHEGGNFDEKNPPNCSQQGCHSALPGWRLAPRAGMMFVGLEQEGLCELMHRSFRYAKITPGEESFMRHMKNDNADAHPGVQVPGFIETGLAGTRGLAPADMIGGPDPPPGWDHGKLMQVSQSWVDAMGGRFHGNTWCGCKKQEYVMRLDWEQTLNLNFGVINGQSKKTTGSPDKPGVDIPLTAKEPKVFTGEGRLTIRQQGQYGTVAGGCTTQGQIAFDIKVTAKIEEGKEEERGQDDKMRVTFECKRAQEQTSGVCPHASGGSDASSSCQADKVTLDFNPPTIGTSQSREFPSPLPNSQTKMSATLLKKE